MSGLAIAGNLQLVAAALAVLAYVAGAHWIFLLVAAGWAVSGLLNLAVARKRRAAQAPR